MFTQTITIKHSLVKTSLVTIIRTNYLQRSREHLIVCTSKLKMIVVQMLNF